MAEEQNVIPQEDVVKYDDDNIQTLSGLDHIRLRPGMYIGRLGDGSSAEDGIYVLLKEVFTVSKSMSRTTCAFPFATMVEVFLRVSSSRVLAF